MKFRTENYIANALGFFVGFLVAYFMKKGFWWYIILGFIFGGLFAGISYLIWKPTEVKTADKPIDRSDAPPRYIPVSRSQFSLLK